MSNPRWAPTIALARRVGQELGADCMILVRSEGGQWGGASWGRTRERCASLGRVMDGLFDDGRLDGMIADEGDVETAKDRAAVADLARHVERR